MPGSKSIVVVGGGGAGAQAAVLLAQTLASSSHLREHTVTLITARPFFIHLPASARFTTSGRGHFEEKCFVPYDRVFSKYEKVAKVKIGRVVRVEPQAPESGEDVKGGEVELESGERIKYDILILAPGSTWAGPLEFPDGREDVKQHLDVWRKKFERAKSVVLVGGGSVSLEYAGEIRDFYPSTKVTIVHNGSMLLNDAYPVKYRRRLEHDARARGVDIVFDDRIDVLEPSTESTVTTRKEKTIPCDLIVPTFGCRPATSFLTSLDPGILNEQGQIKVNQYLQLTDQVYPNIFALGDAIDWPEQKQVGKYDVHASVVASNVISVLEGKQPSKVYQGAREGILITNGKNRGAAYVPLFLGYGVVLGDWFAKFVNGESLRVENVRHHLGYGDN